MGLDNNVFEVGFFGNLEKNPNLNSNQETLSDLKLLASQIYEVESSAEETMDLGKRLMGLINGDTV